MQARDVWEYGEASKCRMPQGVAFQLCLLDLSGSGSRHWDLGILGRTCVVNGLKLARLGHGGVLNMTP